MNPSSDPAARHMRLVTDASAPAGAGAPAPAGQDLVDSWRRLADVFHEVLSEQTLDALLERIATTVGELIPYDDITFYEADEGARTLRAVYARGSEVEQVLADEPFPFGVGITGWAVEHREPVLANRAELDPRVRFVADTPPDPESLIVVPLIARGRLRGTLNIYRSGFSEFTADEFDLVVRFGDAAALAIDNAQIRATLEHQAQTDALTGLLNHRAFHERLREELLRASAARGTVALIMLDLDDFKRVNDVYGHAVGDDVLVETAEVLRSCLRNADLVCRIGGEEFAVIVPSGTIEDALRLAERLTARVAGTVYEPAGTLSVSVGVAAGPEHAANPRELVACAEAAMMTAKARGKDRIVLFEEDATERPAPPAREREAGRSIAHLKLLQSISARLARLNDLEQIGMTIAEELRQLIDYHNCRVFIRHGDELRPIAFRGELTISDGSELERIATRVGVGVTGRVAETGQPLLVPDAARCAFAEHIEGTAEIEESLLAVPLTYATEVVGVVVVSKLGLDQFDADDLRLLQVLGGHASSALVNAQLYDAQRREAESAKALLELSHELSSVTALDDVAERVVRGAARILDSPSTSLWLRVGDGDLVCRAGWSEQLGDESPLLGTRLPAAALAGFVLQLAPFNVTSDDYAELVGAAGLPHDDAAYGVAPIALDGCWGALAVRVQGERPGLDERELELLDGIASQAKLALANALNFGTLEETFLATVEALANALEAKDEYTSSHARSITDMALRVGEELGLEPAALKRIELGALLHDIGKIGVPASILGKPGPLTEEERRLMEQHPELGERILAPISQLEDVRPIVRACHERFDGAGYPDGLAGEQIPLEARIVFVCDAFHAMTTDRPYRRALSIAEALDRLRAAAGTQFDPAVVDVCLRVLGEPAAR